MDRISTLESVLSRQLAWISAADGRVNFIFPVATAMAGLLAAVLPKFSTLSGQAAWLSAAAAVLLGLSIAFAAFATFPRTTSKAGSIIFFGEIESETMDAYVTRAIDCTQESYERDIARQIYINAKIASAKFAWIKRSLACLFLSATPWACSVYLLYQAK